MKYVLRNIKVHLDTYQQIVDLKHGNDTFDTVIRRLLLKNKGVIE